MTKKQLARLKQITVTYSNQDYSKLHTHLDDKTESTDGLLDLIMELCEAYDDKPYLSLALNTIYQKVGIRLL